MFRNLWTMLIVMSIALLVGCNSNGRSQGAPTVEPTSSPPAAATAATTDPLEGNWFHDEVPCSVRHATVIDAGFREADWTAAFPDGCAGEVDGTFELRFLDGRVIGIGDDGTIGWDSTYEFRDDDTVVLDDGFDHSTIDFTIENDTMTMRLVKLTAPTSKREVTYERVFLVAGWMAGPFTRMS